MLQRLPEGSRQASVKLIAASSYWHTPFESQSSKVRIERFLTFEVELSIKLTPKFPRIVAPAVFAVPPN